MRGSEKIAALLLTLVIASGGCAGRDTKDTASVEERAIKAGADGAEAFQRGEYPRAVLMFRESLRLNRSVDDRNGELIALINTARALLETGDTQGAEICLDDAVRLAKETDGRHLSEAYATAAKAALMSGRTAKALGAINEALEIDSDLGYKSGSKLNLKGFILLEEGRTEEAGTVIKEALDLNRSNNDRAELANSKRAMAGILKMKGRLAEAFSFYEEAYEIDRGLGASAKVALDLLSMGEISFLRGDGKEAAFLLERAYIVSLNNGYTKTAIGSLEMLIKTYGGLNDEERASYYKNIKEGLVEKQGGGSGAR